MKKSWITILCAAAALLTFTACGSSDESSAATGNVTVAESSSKEETTAETTTAETTATTEETTAAETTTATEATTKATKKVTKKATTTTKAETQAAASPMGQSVKTDACAEYNGAMIKVDSEFAEYQATLGNPDSKSENTNCLRGANGFSYVYGNMTVNTYIKDNVEYVEDIMVMAEGNAKSGKEVAIGDGKQSVIDNYGEPATSDDASITYTDGNYNIMFYIDADKVIGFHVYAQ